MTTHEQVVERELEEVHMAMERAHERLDAAGINHDGWSLAGRISVLAVRAAEYEAVLRRIAHIDPGSKLVDLLKTEAGNYNDDVAAANEIEKCKAEAQRVLDAHGRESRMVPVLQLIEHPSDAEPGAA